MEGHSSKRQLEEYRVKRGENLYKRIALGTQRLESKTPEGQCPFFSSVNDEIRRINNEYLSDINAHLEYYSNSQRASMHIMKVAGLSAGQRFSFDIENIPVMIMIMVATYGKLGMNPKSFEAALERGKGALEDLMGRDGGDGDQVTAP